MLILALDSATKTAGVALLKDGHPYGEIILNVGLTHSVSLLPAIHSLLSLSGVKLENVDALAYANGPGSFTGLRIGGAFITGLAQTNQLPVYPIPTLDAMALNGEGFAGDIAPILDARKNEFYTATYRMENGYINKITPEKALSPEEFSEVFSEPSNVMVIGDAVHKYCDFLKQKGFMIPSDLITSPRPTNVAYLAYLKYLNNEAHLTYRDVKPFYLRASEAEVKLLEKSR